MNSPGQPFSLLRRLLPWLTVAIAAAAIYDGFVFYSRWASDRAFRQRAAAEDDERNRRAAELYGPDTLRILNFYASPAEVRQGREVTICYSVRAAKTVTLDPPVEPVWPSMVHCLKDSPHKDTEYKLSAVDGAGHSVSQTLIVKVVR